MNRGKLSLKSSLCSKCGYCCYQCEFLGENGCTKPDYASTTICESFPVIFGDPEKLGYQIPQDNKAGERWFIVPEKHCKILYHPFFSKKLNEVIHQLNTTATEIDVIIEYDNEFLRISYLRPSSKLEE